MCGRYVAATPPDQLAEYFDASDHDVLTSNPQIHSSRYNVAPTQHCTVVLQRDGERQLAMLRWGLVPFWARDPSVGARMINARVETVASKPAFKQAVSRRRCLVAADGYYEWKKLLGRKDKQPMFLHRDSGSPLAFAGLWERWREPTNHPDASPMVRETFTILTQPAEASIADIHDRMPVIVPQHGWGDWLDPTQTDPHQALASRETWTPEQLVAHPVSTEVNKVANDGAHLCAEAPPLVTDLGL